ncbi:hypothetical protein [Aureimonas ureilytica]|uniref:hypothetical protein n=1 Tax=Aureimonas ureilytica TaxID=401562 RepID=UPI00035EC66C|nr:hypothetical protein [Aureimonas ureilytica]
MVALQSLSTASTLLKAINVPPTVGLNSTSSTDQAAPSVAQIAAGANVSSTSAAKSVSSAIFNAVTTISEEQDATVRAILDYVTEAYDKIYEKDGWLLENATFPDSVRAAFDQHLAAGALIRQDILADPAGIHKLYQQIKASRPDASPEGIITLVIAELGTRRSKAAAG